MARSVGYGTSKEKSHSAPSKATTEQESRTPNIAFEGPKLLFSRPCLANFQKLPSSLRVIYFSCMALAHYFGFKVPVLFVYYDTPFFAYQDKIISFSVCAYIALFALATRSRENAFVAIIVLFLTGIGLSSVNLSRPCMKY